MNQVKIIIASVVVVGVAICTLAWWCWPHREDPQVVTVKRLQQQLFQQRESLSDAQRAQMFQQLRRETEQLSETQRQQLRRELFNGFYERMVAQVKKFHALPAEQRTVYLDEQIDAMESMRRQAGASRGGPPGAAQPPGIGAGRNLGPGPRGSGPGGRPKMSQEQREQRRRERLDNSNARERAEFAAFFEAMQERRKQRGLPEFGRPRRWSD
jgi:hypothetical protein